MTNESQRYNCFTRNGGNATPKHASPEAKGSNPTTKLTLLWARNPVRRNFNHWKVSRKPRNRLPRVMKHYSPTDRRNHGRPLKRLLDTWDRNGSTSGPTPWHIWWGWWFNKAYHIQQRAQLGKRKKYPPPPLGSRVRRGRQQNWGQNKYFKLTKYSLRPTNFKLLGQIKANSINNRHFFLYFVISVRDGHCDCSHQGSKT